MMESVVASVAGKPFDIFFSGGVDSSTVLFAALECGYKPRCITFDVENVESSDRAVSASICRAFGLKHDIVTIPSDIDALLEDVTGVIRDLVEWEYQPRILARLIQVMHPALYLVPEMVADIALTGSAGDLLALTSRQDCVRVNEEGESRAWALRTFKHGRKTESDYLFDRYARTLKKRVHHPLEDVEIFRWARGLPRHEFNWPRQKAAMVACFEDHWRRGAWYRKNSPYQINSGLKRLHDKLLTSSYNRRSYVAVIGVYREIADTLGIRCGARRCQDVFLAPQRLGFHVWDVASTTFAE